MEKSITELKLIATSNGFKTHDDRMESYPIYLKCNECVLLWLYEQSKWLIDNHSIYIQPQCFNTYNWGVRIYKLTGDNLKGAPIVYEEELAEHVSINDALIAGLLEGYRIING